MIKTFEDIIEERKITLRNLKDLIVNYYPLTDVYIFGSYAKGRVHQHSDIDLLLITQENNLSPKEVRDKKFQIEEYIEDNFGFNPEVQLVMVTQELYDKTKDTNPLFIDISKYMLKII